jgi:acylaminoacyl-peptidase
MLQRLSLLFLLIGLTGLVHQSEAQTDPHFTLQNVFDLEYASSPEISPDGNQIVYQRSFMDIMDDRVRSNLWIINSDGSRHRPLTSGNNNNYSPLWSPSGDRLLYISTQSGSSELYIRWMDTGESAKITNLTQSPSGLSWSPDGEQIAFTMFVPRDEKPLVSLPGKPDGADWADPAVLVDDLRYRNDGSSGFVPDGYEHLFVITAEGGSPRQITSGPYNHSGTPQWTADGEHLIISSNRKEDWEYNAQDTEIHKVSVEDGSMMKLTDRRGPDYGAAISPDGERIAYLGYDDEYEGYQITNLYVMNADGSDKQLLTENFDRNVGNVQWADSDDGVFVQYDDEGNGKVGFVSMDGEVQKLADDVGSSIGRPYGGGSYSVAANGRFAFTYITPYHPSDVAVGSRDQNAERITDLNKDLFGHKTLGEVEEIWYESSYDGQKIQGWIVKPPDFDPDKQYPLILEIHGGPFANYGDRFTAEIQLMASAGYVVLYTNPRGSSSYGKEFGNYIHHNYPSEDYDDLMSGVDAVIDRGYVNSDSLYITGGSGGGVLTAWTIGKTDRFNAAVVAKPVINWYSFVLTSDGSPFFYKYWFPGFPWENRDHYMDRSPISLAGNVTTPTMLLTGEQDYRTPMSETEQYYTALQLQKVESVMVRIPGSGHGIASRPSNLMSKVAHILEWFDRH